MAITALAFLMLAECSLTAYLALHAPALHWLVRAVRVGGDSCAASPRCTLGT